MSMNIGQFATDVAKETSGVWHTIGAGAEILVARAGNKNYQKELRLRMKPHRRRINRDDAGMEEIAGEILNKCAAKFILLGWKGIDGENGKPVKYSYDNALKFFVDYPEFYTMVMELASDVEAYRVEEEDSIVKN